MSRICPGDGSRLSFGEGEYLENDTKYQLKKAEELARVMAGTDHIFVITCNKCFKELEMVAEPECAAFLELAHQQGKTVTGTAQLDFVCNKTKTAKALVDQIPAETESVFVISCGLGVQTVAEMVALPVFAAADTKAAVGHKGMALDGKACDACAQCYLNLTGGICPVVDCTKGLLNGQCGGARNGKCEANPAKDCAWEKIQQRLKAQGRLEELQAQGVQLRDYSKVNPKRIREYVNSIRERHCDGYDGGIHPAEDKERTCHLRPIPLPAPDVVAVNLAQHAGTPANCVVAVGDWVKVGQKVGEASTFISANLHSPVSGKVVAIEKRTHATRGDQSLSVIIENDRKNTLHESVRPHKPLAELTGEEIVEIVKEAGIVGMGGAGFPMYVKLQPGKPIDTVLLNGCECEPMLTADHQVMLQYADDVIFGLKAMMKAVNAPRGILVIEDNKPDAIALMKEKTGAEENIQICVAKTKYPQGGERMLIKRALGRQVPGGGLPADVGCVVANVSTSKSVSDAIQRGMPVTERVVTVTGNRVKNPGNFIVKIGTDVRQLLDYCGGVTDGGDYTVKIGGPMMGTVQRNPNVAITKCSNGIIVCDAEKAVPRTCIRCGRCVDICPMRLKPLYFAKYAGAGKPRLLKDLKITDCMECGCCEYICSSGIPLTDLIKIGKYAVRGMKEC